MKRSLKPARSRTPPPMADAVKPASLHSGLLAGAVQLVHFAWIGVLGISLVVGALTGRSPRRETPLAIGSAAPAFELPGLFEPATTHALSAQRGRVVMLAFWSTQVLESRGSLVMLEALRRSFSEESVQVFAVALEATQDATRASLVARQLAPSIEHLNDAAGSAIAAYRLTRVPAWFLVDRSGRIVAQGGVPMAGEEQIRAALAATG